MAQLALEFSGSNIISEKRSVTGIRTVTRQYSYTLLLLQHSEFDGERANTSGFLDDFTEWVSEMSYRHQIPAFGDDPQNEVTRVDGGTPLADWSTGRSTVYQVNIRKIYSKIYESEDN